MTNELLPIIAELADARSHFERARWLLACPIAILRRYDMTIRNRLMLAGFHVGIDYLETIIVGQSATRDPASGLPAAATIEMLSLAGRELVDWAEAQDAARPWPKADPTEL